MSDPLENKVSITQNTQLSRERMEGTDLTRFVFDQTRGVLRFTSWPKSSLPLAKKRLLPAVAWCRGVVTMVVVVLGPTPKWNDKGRMRKGCQGRGRIQPMGSTYPVFVVGIAGGRWRVHAL